METPEIKALKRDDDFMIRFWLYHPVPEYLPTVNEGEATLTKIFDHFDVLEEEEKSRELGADERAFDRSRKLLAEQENQVNHVLHEVDELGEQGDIYEICIQAHSPEYLGIDWFIDRFLANFAGQVISVWLNHGGDDDYYDYIPSFTDMFRQLCQINGKMGFYKETIRALLQFQMIRDEFYGDNPLYDQDYS